MAGVDAYNDLSCARYGKIIIATDADADGAAISALLLGMFAEHLKFLIENGRIYINQSPLFLQDGKYLRPDEVDQLNKNKPFTRFKGLIN
jgi:DNA gyrase/topoisomerase IV subunit B